MIPDFSHFPTRLALAASRHRHRSCIELHFAMDNPSDKLLLRIKKLEASPGGSAEDAAQLQKLQKKLKKLLGRGFLLSVASEQVKEADAAGEQPAPKSAGKHPVKGRLPGTLLPPYAAVCVHGYVAATTICMRQARHVSVVSTPSEAPPLLLQRMRQQRRRRPRKPPRRRKRRSRRWRRSQ